MKHSKGLVFENLQKMKINVRKDNMINGWKQIWIEAKIIGGERQKEKVENKQKQNYVEQYRINQSLLNESVWNKTP